VQADLASDSQKGDRSTVERFGRVDILVINAAVFPPSMFVEVSAATRDYTMDADREDAYSSPGSRPSPTSSKASGRPLWEHNE
jgi:NAD(P)-dependent dehydrogenase (short-subunit alcohol dehydrogenase family)